MNIGIDYTVSHPIFGFGAVTAIREAVGREDHVVTVSWENPIAYPDQGTDENPRLPKDTRKILLSNLTLICDENGEVIEPIVEGGEE